MLVNPSFLIFYVLRLFIIFILYIKTRILCNFLKFYIIYKAFFLIFLSIFLSDFILFFIITLLPYIIF
ncbi:putative membrane protein [[Clostridium] sordellii ATCC 9714]|nr:putative membrane protein [[Clostridium] sordellii ATCC 9714] [Paeniclostridium sordellii ATCC 9714]